MSVGSCWGKRVRLPMMYSLLSRSSIQRLYLASLGREDPARVRAYSRVPSCAYALLLAPRRRHSDEEFVNIVTEFAFLWLT